MTEKGKIYTKIPDVEQNQKHLSINQLQVSKTTGCKTKDLATFLTWK